jgi:hypothetical protein
MCDLSPRKSRQTEVKENNVCVKLWHFIWKYDESRVIKLI